MVAGMTYVGAAAVTRSDRVTPDNFSGYATGTALHVTGLQSGTTRLVDVDEAFSGAAVRTDGLTPIANEFSVTVTPATIPLTGKAAGARGAGLELGLGNEIPTSSQTRQLILAGIAEATAPPNGPEVVEEIAVPADPLLYAQLLEGRAFASIGDLLNRCPSSSFLQSDFGRGRGRATDVQLIEGGDDVPPTEDFEAPVLATDVSSQAVLETVSRVFPIANGDGTFGLRAVISSLAVPIRLNLPPDTDETNDVIIRVGAASLTLTATGKPGGAKVEYSAPPTPNVEIGGSFVPLPLPQLIAIPGLLELAIGEGSPRAIGGPPGSAPTESSDGTTVSAAVDGVRLSIPPALPGPVDPQLVDVRVQHFEGALKVPDGGFSFNDCGQLRVTKNVVGGLPGPFTFNVSCPGVTLLPEEQTFQLANGESKIIPVPSGTQCTVTEPGRGGATTTTVTESPTSGASGTDGVVTIPTGLQTVNVAFTNSSLGQLQVFKTAQQGLNGPFSFTVTCTNGGNPVTLATGDAAFTLGPNANKLISNIPGGSSCRVVETNSGGAVVTRITDSSGPNTTDGIVTIAGGATQSVAFSNAGSPLVVSKVTTGAQAGGKGPFRFHVECRSPAGSTIALDPAEADFSLNGGQEKRINRDMPDGTTCTVTEVDKGGATTTMVTDTSGASTTDGVVVIKHLETQAVTFTNNFADLIKLVVNKTVVGTGTGPFRFQVACTNNNAPVALAPGDASFQLNGGQSKSIANIPNGSSCSVTETDTRGAVRTFTETSGTPNDGIVTIPADGAVTVGVVNTFVTPAQVPPAVIQPRTVG